jgi:hypothetical protein
MSHLRLRIKLNKGRRGIPLEKLERIVSETRKFLIATSQDLEIPSPESWIGVDFRNGSLLYTNESAETVAPTQIQVFNQSLIHLSKGELAPQLQHSTAEHFFGMFEALEPREDLGIGIYENGSARAKWLKVSREIALLPSTRAGLSIRESIGSVQGTVHVWFRLASPPYFNLRELSTQALIKCFYDRSDYEAVLLAVQKETQVVHVHGRIFTDMPGRCIDHIDADRIVPVEPFSFDDLEKFLDGDKTQ